MSEVLAELKKGGAGNSGATLIYAGSFYSTALNGTTTYTLDGDYKQIFVIAVNGRAASSQGPAMSYAGSATLEKSETSSGRSYDRDTFHLMNTYSNCRKGDTITFTRASGMWIFSI